MPVVEAKRMGKKGKWLAALKNAFSPRSKHTEPSSDNGKFLLAQSAEKKIIRDKKRWGLFKSKRREPSSVELILADVEVGVHPKREKPSPARLGSRRPPDANASAVMIQAAFRGYIARRNYRALKGLIRLQGVIRGSGVRQQTARTMRLMRMLVRAQMEVRQRRMETLGRRGRPAMRTAAMDFQLPGWQEESNGGEWNDSVLNADEAAARLRRKAEAALQRERALAYAYSHKPTAAHAILADIRSGQELWWWTPLKADPEPKPIQRKTTKGASSLRSLLRDDQSMASCPPCATPSYMAPTASAKAKAKDRTRACRPEEKRRFSFGPIRWGGKAQHDATPPPSVRGHRRRLSVSGLSIDSTASLPAGIGRSHF